MKTKIILFFCILPVLFYAQRVNALSPAPEQQLEILKQEIAVLQTLISNFNLRQEISSPAYVAIDLSNNAVLAEKNSGASYCIASVTKLMTAVIASENVDMNKTITLTEEMLSPMGSSPVLYAGLSVSAEKLLKATLIQSTNDAAQSLSYFLGNQKFLELMNQKAKELGMTNTVYYDVHGLNSLNRSTASDLAKLAAYVNQKHPQIWSITRNNDFWMPDSSGRQLKFMNVNNFYYLGDFVGGKTGYIPEAKQTMASVFKVSGKQVAITLLYSKNRMADIFNILRQLKTKI